MLAAQCFSPPGLRSGTKLTAQWSPEIRVCTPRYLQRGNSRLIEDFRGVVCESGENCMEQYRVPDQRIQVAVNPAVQKNAR